MNCRYFACPRCCVYADAGYRWAYWTLEEPGVVTENEVVDVMTVLSTGEYWNVPESGQSEWLSGEILPPVKRFLIEHAEHGVVYVTEAVFDEDAIARNWHQVGR